MALTDTQFKTWLAAPDSVRAALVEVTAQIAGVETLLYLSSRNYTTAAADAPAHTAYLACIAGGVSFSEELSLDGAPSISYGDLEIHNASGERDGWLDYVWANRAIAIYIGDPRWPRADFRKVFGGIVGDIAMRSPQVLNLKLLDKLQRLNAPISEALLGGATDNKDRLIPLTFGECHNVEPLLTSPATLVYKYHGGAVERLIEVRDNGAPITSYTSSLSTGQITLTAAPVGQITASVQGDKPAAGYTTNISTLVQRIATTYGPAASRLSAGDLDSASLSAFATANPQPVGLYCADRTNILAACQMLAASVGAQVVMTTTGLLRLVELALPALGTPVAVTASDMEAGSLVVSARPPVRAAARLGYCKNWTVQTSGLATGLPAASAASFAADYLTVTPNDSTTATKYKTDTQPPEEVTLLLATADATAEAARRLALWQTPRSIYTARYYAHLLLTELGDPLTITHRRFGLSAGKTGIVTRISRDWLKGRIEIGVLA